MASDMAGSIRESVSRGLKLHMDPVRLSVPVTFRESEEQSWFALNQPTGTRVWHPACVRSAGASATGATKSTGTPPWLRCFRCDGWLKDAPLHEGSKLHEFGPTGMPGAEVKASGYASAADISDLRVGDKVAVTLTNKVWRGEVIKLETTAGGEDALVLKGLVGGSHAFLKAAVMSKKTGVKGVWWSRYGSRGGGEGDWVKSITTDTAVVNKPRRKSEPTSSQKAAQIPGVTYSPNGAVLKTAKNLATFFSSVVKANSYKYDDMSRGDDLRSGDYVPTDAQKKGWIADLLGSQGEYISATGSSPKGDSHVYHIHGNYWIDLWTDPAKVQKAASSMAPGQLPGVKYSKSGEVDPSSYDAFFAQVGSVARSTNWRGAAMPDRSDYVSPKEWPKIFAALKTGAASHNARINVCEPHDGSHMASLPSMSIGAAHHAQDHYRMMPKRQIRAAERAGQKA